MLPLMRSQWRAMQHRLGWAVVCDAPLRLVLEFGLLDDLEEPVGDWIFNTRFAAEHLAEMLNAMEAARR